MSDYREVDIPLPESITVIPEDTFARVARLTIPSPLSVIFHPDGELLHRRTDEVPHAELLATLLGPIARRINERELEEESRPPDYVHLKLYRSIVKPGSAQLEHADDWHADDTYVAGTKPTTQCLHGKLNVLLPTSQGQTLYTQARAYLNTEPILPETLSIWAPAPGELIRLKREEPDNIGTLHRSAPHLGQNPVLRTVIIGSPMHSF